MRRNFILRLVFIDRTDYICPMNFRMLVVLISAAGLLAGRAATAAGTAPTAAEAPQNPYDPIVQRNMFDLVPIPVHNPADDVPVNPPPKISPNGIMRLFGKLQVLFKVAEPGQPGKPGKDESYTLGEGERENDITVQKIDEVAATITFDNHGTIQQLPLVATTAAAGGGPAPGAPGKIPPPGMPGMAPAVGGSPAPIGFGGRFGRNRNNPNPGAANPNAGASPEEQIYNMESQRAKWLDEGNPAAAIIPPTALTKQVTGEGDAGANGGGGPPGP